MNQSLQLFEYGNQQVRTVLISGQPGFVANDLCKILEIKNSRDALAALDIDEKGVATIDTPGGRQEMAVVNEPGMYSLVLRSRKPEAKKFKRWITHEVLPEIRKTGSYGSPAELTRSDLARMILEAEEEKAELQGQLEIAAPKVTYVDEFVADNDCLLFRTVASTLGVGEHALRWALVYSGWIYHDSQRRRNSKGEIVTEHQWSEYSHKKDYFQRVMNHEAPLFKGNTKFTLKITPAGASAIARLVKKIIDEFGSFDEALPQLEARYRRKKAA